MIIDELEDSLECEYGYASPVIVQHVLDALKAKDEEITLLKHDLDNYINRIGGINSSNVALIDKYEKEIEENGLLLVKQQRKIFELIINITSKCERKVGDK